MNLISMFIIILLIQFLVLNRYSDFYKEKRFLKFGFCYIITIIISSLIIYLIYNFILLEFDLIYLLLILVIAILYLVTKILFKKEEIFSMIMFLIPSLIGILIVSIEKKYGLALEIIFTLLSSFLLLLFTYIFYTVKEYISNKEIDSFKGYPILFITAAILVLILSRISI